MEAGGGQSSRASGVCHPPLDGRTSEEGALTDPRSRQIGLTHPCEAPSRHPALSPAPKYRRTNESLNEEGQGTVLPGGARGHTSPRTSPAPLGAALSSSRGPSGKASARAISFTLRFKVTQMRPPGRPCRPGRESRSRGSAVNELLESLGSW